MLKVEHPADKERQAYASLPGVDPDRPDQLAPLFALNSRGKKSVALDLKEKAGRAALERLLSTADVFLSNLREAALERLDLGCSQLRERFPKLVIARVTGYGRYGDSSDLAAYEPTAWWARGGMAASVQSYGAEIPPMMSSGTGDHTTGMAMAGGVAAALFQAQRTGEGAVVDTSLLRSAMYTNGWANQFVLALGGSDSPHEAVRVMKPYSSPIPYWGSGPLSGLYRCGDGKALYLSSVAPHASLPLPHFLPDQMDLPGAGTYNDADSRRYMLCCEALGRPDLAADPRFGPKPR